MGIKKHKQCRRTVTFYKACFGFREPFKVLCDGSFVHYCLKYRLGGLQDSLSNLLGARAKPLVTRCVIEELKNLGEAYSGAALAARRLDVIRCEHEPVLPAAECMTTLVGSHNEEHYFVATQDWNLRKQFRKVRGGALILAKNTSLALEGPSDMQKQYAKMGEQERNRLSEREKHLLGVRQKKKEEELLSLQQKEKEEELLSLQQKEKEEELLSLQQKKKGKKEEKDVKESDGSALPVEQKVSTKSQTPLGEADQTIFKRKRAKGSNPLTCKKKTKIKGEQKSSEQNSAATDAGVESQKKKKKKK